MRDFLDNIIVVVICILLLAAIIGFVKHNIEKSKYITQLEMKVNQLQFEKDYLEYVYEDNIKQEI